MTDIAISPTPKLNKLSLFSGIGGDDLASEWAGIKTICFVEKDERCQKHLMTQWPNTLLIGDITDVTKEKVGYVDIISGGDPCQPRSIAGKRRGKEDDRDLWKDMLRVIRDFKPTWVVNENPTGRLTMDFLDILSDLESLGYETRSFVIPACSVLALHRRDRVFIIAHANGDGLKRRRGLETQSGVATRKVEIPSTWNVPCYTFKDWEKLNNTLGCVRRYDGLSRTLVRWGIRAFGNTVVPQQIYPIYKAIVEIEMQEVRQAER